MRLCDLDEIKICVNRQYEDCHGYSGNKKAIYREAILAVKSILHSAKPIDAVHVVRCKDCLYSTERYGHMECIHGVSYRNTWNKPDFYCAHGERKEGTD